MTLIRPCIDLHSGVVKQIVGSTLDVDDPTSSTLKTNFVSQHPPSYYAELYKRDGMQGAHVIKLGAGNDEAAEQALAAWPGELQIGGGITADNAQYWLSKGAAKVIVTSYLFPSSTLSLSRLQMLSSIVPPSKLVIDLSCKRVSAFSASTDPTNPMDAKAEEWVVAINGWKTLTDSTLSQTSTLLSTLAPYCSEFLVHSTSVEGLQTGPDLALIKLLSDLSPLPVTYAGGARNMEDLRAVERVSSGKVDLTFGSALDIFGGTGVKWEDCVTWNRSKRSSQQAPSN